MSLIMREKISDQELIKRITSRNVSEYDLMREFHISDSALRKYKRNSNPSKVRISESRMKLLVLDFSLSFLEKQGLQNPFSFLKNLHIEGIPLLKFINDNAKDKLIVITIKLALKTSVKETVTKAIDRYREKYEFLNDETLAIAAEENPELLKELIEDKDLRPSTRGDILEALAVGGRPEYFDYINSKVEESAPHIREAAFLGLYEYYDSSPDYSFLRDLFREKLESEKAEGVHETISALLKEMQAA